MSIESLAVEADGGDGAREELAEQAILGAFLADWEGCRAHVARLRPELFTEETGHRTIAVAIRSMAERGLPAIDAVTVGLEAPAVAPVALALGRAIGTTANVAHYLAALEEARRKGPAGIALDKRAPTIGTVLLSAMDALEDRAAGRARAVPLPWPSLAAHMGGGLWPGLHVLVGNTGSGKTQLAIEAAHVAAHAGVPAAYVGLELDHPGIAARLLALEMRRRDPRDRTAWSTLYLGESDRATLGRAAQASDSLFRLPLHVEVAPPMGWAYGKLRSLAEGMRARYPAGPILIVLDFLQLVDGAERELRERIGRAAYAGRAAARDQGVSVLFVSSTARTSYAALAGGEEEAPGSGSPSRLIGLGKESGEIEYAADTLLAMVREPDSRHVWCGVAKVRARSGRVEALEGPARAGWIRLAFDGTRFAEDLAPASAPRPSAGPTGGDRDY